MTSEFGCVPCAVEHCATFLRCDRRHVDNLTAARWTCPSHTEEETP